jgi:hypothetical protein
MKNKIIELCRFFVAGVTLLALFMLVGCVQTVTLVVFNNSGKDVCITALGGKHDLKRQTAIRILAAAESKHSLQVTDSVGNSYTASFTTPLHWNFHHYIYLQLEKDMKIYRVHNDKFPHNPLPEQTEGFPVDLAGGKQ